MAKLNSLRDILIMKLQMLYDVEKEIEVALPKMAEEASDMTLKEGFETHLEETREQIQRLEQVFEILDEKPSKQKSETIRGMVKDTAVVIEADTLPTLRDSMLASAGRHVEQYEISLYTTAIDIANTLNLESVSDILSESLDEEELADEILENAVEKSLEEIGGDGGDSE